MDKIRKGFQSPALMLRWGWILGTFIAIYQNTDDARTMLLGVVLMLLPTLLSVQRLLVKPAPICDVGDDADVQPGRVTTPTH